MCGSRAAQSCDGCAAVWMTTETSAPNFAENSRDSIVISNVDVMVLVSSGRLACQAISLPTGRRLRSEEDAAHVVVDADNVIPGGSKRSSRLRADETRGTCDESN